MQDEELRELALSLPEVALRSKAPSTVKKYSGAFCRWKRWVRNKPEVSALPANPLHVALYLNFLIQKADSSAPIQEAVSAIAWCHQLAVVDDPTQHPLVKNVLASSKRMLAKQTLKKEPITPEILSQLVDKAASNLSDVRTLAIMLVGYAGFFRFDELARIREADVTIYQDHLEIFLESSKTDQYRDGSRVVIARTNNKLCPVAMLEQYLALAQSSTCSDQFLFRGLVHTKNGFKLRQAGSISYTRVRELVLTLLESIGLDRKQFGLHSLRSGGASAAANAGVPDRCFKRHGRWKSENAKDGYVKDDLQQRLDVSRNIGL